MGNMPLLIMADRHVGQTAAFVLHDSKGKSPSGQECENFFIKEVLKIILK
jgi:hypothetical protein